QPTAHHTCYLAALSSLKNSPASRAFYERKRAEGNLTSKPLSHSPDAASTSRGPCSATKPPTRNAPASTGPGCLTKALRFPMPWGAPVGRLDRSLADRDHRRDVFGGRVRTDASSLASAHPAGAQ